MNLSEIREAFGKLSGRTDLANEDTDLADLYINEASRYLDRSSEQQKSVASFYAALPANGWNVQIPLSRAIRSVYISSTTARWKAVKISLQEMLDGYLYAINSTLPTGSPYVYCPAVTRNIPESGVLPTDIANYVDVLSTSGQSYNAILIAPSPTEQLMIDVQGLFYSNPLVSDSDENFWSVTHPLLLLHATMREVEVSNRNSSGVKDWDTAIMTALDGINKDLVEEQIAEADQMEG
jgi:hypothetical protein